MVAIPINSVALAVEVPLMGVALGTVALRIWSRIAVKGKLATDDLLIILGAVSQLYYRIITELLTEDYRVALSHALPYHASVQMISWVTIGKGEYFLPVKYDHVLMLMVALTKQRRCPTTSTSSNVGLHTSSL